MIPVSSVKSARISLIPGSWFASQIETDNSTSLESEPLSDSLFASVPSSFFPSSEEPPQAVIENTIALASANAITFFNFMIFSSL